MIINGRSRRCVWWWSKHLQDENENERVNVVKIEGLASENVYDLLCEIEAQGLGTRCKNPLWIAAINPGPKEQFSEQDRERAREILEQERGYQGQPYFMVEHEKKGWKHWHVIYSRIDAEHMRVLPDGLDAKVCHAAARRIESELGLQKVIGPFDREQGTPRPSRAPKPWEMYRGMQTSIDPREIEAEVTALFRLSETGKAFKAALESQGYQLVTGNRGLLIMDSAGKEHSLARRIEGMTAKTLNAFMHDIDRKVLPTLDRAREQFHQQKIEDLEADRATVRKEIEWEEKLAIAAIAKEERERAFVELNGKAGQEQIKNAGGRKKEQGSEKPLDSASVDIRLAWSLSDSPNAFARRLDDLGFRLARTTKEEADISHRNAAYAREIGRYAPEYREGEIVAVDLKGHVLALNRGTTGESRANAAAFLRTLDQTRLNGIQQTQEELSSQMHEPKKPKAFEEKLFANERHFRKAGREMGQRIEAPAELGANAREIWTSYQRSTNIRHFVKALEERDLRLAVVTEQDVVSNNIQQHYKTDKSRLLPKELREGNFVVVASDGYVYNLNKRTTGEASERVQKALAKTLDRMNHGSVMDTLKQIEERGAQRELGRQAFRDVSRGSLKKEPDGRPTGPLGRPQHKWRPFNERAAESINNKTGRTIGKAFDGASDAFQSLFAPILTPQQKQEVREAKALREAERDAAVDFSQFTEAQARQREQEEQEAKRAREGHGRDR